jgi:hypothetical protein
MEPNKNPKKENSYKHCNIDINDSSSSGSNLNSESHSSIFKLNLAKKKLEDALLIENANYKKENEELNYTIDQLKKENQILKDKIKKYESAKNNEKNQAINSSQNEMNLIKKDETYVELKNKIEKLKALLEEKIRKIEALKTICEPTTKNIIKSNLQYLENGDEHNQEILENILKHNPNLRDDYSEGNKSESNESDKEPEDESISLLNEIDSCISKKMKFDNNLEDMKTEDNTQKALKMDK